MLHFLSTLRRIHSSFYFNKELNECKYFFYGGCGANGNNFEKLDECEQKCAKGGAPKVEVPTFTTTPAAAVQPTTQRPLLLPPPENQYLPGDRCSHPKSVRLASDVAVI